MDCMRVKVLTLTLTRLALPGTALEIFRFAFAGQPFALLLASIHHVPVTPRAARGCRPQAVFLIRSVFHMFKSTFDATDAFLFVVCV